MIHIHSFNLRTVESSVHSPLKNIAIMEENFEILNVKTEANASILTDITQMRSNN